MSAIPVDWGSGGNNQNPKDSTALRPSQAQALRDVADDLAAGRTEIVAAIVDFTDIRTQLVAAIADGVAMRAAFVALTAKMDTDNTGQNGAVTSSELDTDYAAVTDPAALTAANPGAITAVDPAALLTTKA